MSNRVFETVMGLQRKPPDYLVPSESGPLAPAASGEHRFRNPEHNAQSAFRERRRRAASGGPPAASSKATITIGPAVGGR